MTVFLSFNRDGTVNGVFAEGERSRAWVATRTGMVEAWFVGLPEAGPCRFRRGSPEDLKEVDTQAGTDLTSDPERK